MFTRNKPTADTRPDAAIDIVVAHLAGAHPESEEFTAMVDNLTKLYALKSVNTDPNRLSKETLATIVANLLGIGMIVGHERAHVVTTKALGFIMKARP